MRKDYAFDLDAMAAAIDDNTRLVFLGNPEQSDRHHLSHAPSGTVFLSVCPNTW